jgi:hypothetical protein
MLLEIIHRYKLVRFIQNQEAAIIAKEQQADDLYKKAVQSGDADLMSKADTLKK